MEKTLHGIQHLGVGVADHSQSWKWYRKFFGLDIPFFDAEAPAPLMTIYTQNEVINKRAAMVMNMKGGCAVEIVQATSFSPVAASREIQLGDLGIFIGVVKTPSIQTAFEYCKRNDANLVSDIVDGPEGEKTFYLKDPNNLLWQLIESKEWYSKKGKSVTGGVVGSSIGVSDMERSITFYAALGYDKVLRDQTAKFSDWQNLPGGNRTYRRVKLVQSRPSGGGFTKLSGETYIELVKDMSDRTPFKIFEDRKWADIGFVHLGWDVRNMKAIEEDLTSKGYPFTCDSKEILNMGETTKVHCTYLEDPDGTLIELIEVYKIAIAEKLGIFLNVEKRDPKKAFPDFLLKAMRFNRVKD